MELLESSVFNTSASSSQGVCFDGTYYYVSDNTSIYKYTSGGSLVTSHNCSSDGTVHHLGDLCVVSGVLYVVADNYPTTPAKGYIQEYNASDLSYRNTEYQTHTSKWAASVAYDGTYFWTTTDDNQIEVWDSGFTNPTIISTDFTPVGSHGWNGICWYGGYLYANAHEGAEPNCVQEFEYENGELTLVDHYPRPKFCTQGLDIVDGQFIFALRGYSLISDGVVLADLVPYDWRSNEVSYGDDSTERNKTSTSYTEETNLKVSIYAKKWDLIRVELQGNFRVSAGAMRAYIDPSGTNASSTIQLYPVRTIRTNSTSTEGVSMSQVRHFLAQQDGVFTFSMYWKQNTSGTIYVDDRSLVATIDGKNTD